VDAGFAYAVPDRLDDIIAIGSIVRVPLGGRTVRGYVIGLSKGSVEGLREVRAVSGAQPVFRPALLNTLRWSAQHYVAPLSVLLSRSGPPSLPVAPGDVESVAERQPGFLNDRAKRAAAGERVRATYALAPKDPSMLLAATAAPLLLAGKSVLVVAPTGVEVERLAAGLRDLVGSAVVEVLPDHDDRSVTASWSTACGQPASLVVGTHRTSLWPVADLGLAVLVDEGRRAMKDRQTPTLHARDLLRTRAAVERFWLLMVGMVPSCEALGAGVEVLREPGTKRAWPLVEVADRTEDPPGSGVFGERAKAALRAVAAAGGQAFVLTHRSGYAPAMRCVRCRLIRQCGVCSSRPDPGDSCSRCGAPLGPCVGCGGNRFEPLGAGVGRVTEELRRLLGPDVVGSPESDAAVWVGTERHLPGLPRVDLAVAVDVDGLMLGTSYRAGEEALRVLARLAATVDRGRRMLAQTSRPDAPMLEALRRGDPMPYLRSELEGRAALGFPPTAELLAIEVRGEGAAAEDETLRGAAGPEVSVLGPAPAGDGVRWLGRGHDLSRFRQALRPVVERWRQSGLTVRVDADPLDL
jgi:primosomal protein N' (replication factor Y)